VAERFRALLPTLGQKELSGEVVREKCAACAAPFVLGAAAPHSACAEHVLWPVVHLLAPVSFTMAYATWAVNERATRHLPTGQRPRAAAAVASAASQPARPKTRRPRPLFMLAPAEACCKHSQRVSTTFLLAQLQRHSNL
jgi:hypothetical protein